jgi:hypothetical protein
MAGFRLAQDDGAASHGSAPARATSPAQSQALRFGQGNKPSAGAPRRQVSTPAAGHQLPVLTDVDESAFTRF